MPSAPLTIMAPTAPDAAVPDVLGVAYLITADQYIKVLGSEGGGIAYEDIEVDAVPISPQDQDRTGKKLKVRTLGAAIERHPSPKPSKRYMVSSVSITCIDAQSKGNRCKLENYAASEKG